MDRRDFFKKITAGMTIPLFSKDANALEGASQEYETVLQQLMETLGLPISFPDITNLELHQKEVVKNNLKFLVQGLKYNEKIKSNLSKIQEIAKISQLTLTLQGPSYIDTVKLQGSDTSLTILIINVLNSAENIEKFLLNLIQTEEHIQELK